MMSLTWYLIGLIAGGTVYLLFKAYKTYAPGLPVLIGSFIGAGLILFSIAWGMGSVLEGVPRAAAIGLLMFGLPGLVLLTYSARLLKTPKKE